MIKDSLKIFASNLLNFPVKRVDILNRAKAIKSYGICKSIYQAGKDYNLLIGDIEDIFPDFTYQNALKFNPIICSTSESYGCYWWKRWEWDTGRMDFLNWLISRYETNDTNLRKLLQKK